MTNKTVLSVVLLAALGGFAGSAAASADLAKKLNCAGCHTPRQEAGRALVQGHRRQVQG
jgi:cytochrome c551/c552